MFTSESLTLSDCCLLASRSRLAAFYSFKSESNTLSRSEPKQKTKPYETIKLWTAKGSCGFITTATLSFETTTTQLTSHYKNYTFHYFFYSNRSDTHPVFHRWLMSCLPLQTDLTLSAAASCLYVTWGEVETGRMTALVRAVNWETLGYALIGHMVHWDEREETGTDY